MARQGAVARITLERPPLNIIDRSLSRSLAAAVREQSAEAGVAVIVLHGGDARGFSAGVEAGDHVPERVRGMLENFHAAIRALWEAECVTVAAVHGFALGGGLELALACDLVVVEEGVRLGLPETGLGCYPPAAAAMLSAQVGWHLACELVLRGEPFGAERGAAMGLVNRIARARELESEVGRLLAPLLDRSPAVLREAKRALREGIARPPEEALARIEHRYLESLMRLEDAEEGIRAFLDKRAPAWRNR